MLEEVDGSIIIFLASKDRGKGNGLLAQQVSAVEWIGLCRYRMCYLPHMPLDSEPLVKEIVDVDAMMALNVRWNFLVAARRFDCLYVGGINHRARIRVVRGFHFLLQKGMVDESEFSCCS